MDAIWDYIISRATTNPWRVVLILPAFVMLMVMLFLVCTKKYKDPCTAMAIGRIVRVKDDKWYSLDKVREVVIRCRIGERDMTVTHKVSVNIGCKGRCLGDKVEVFYNPDNPSVYYVIYDCFMYKTIKYTISSPLMQVFIVFLVAALLLSLVAS